MERIVRRISLGRRALIAALCVLSLVAGQAAVARAAGAPRKPWVGSKGVTESVRTIMARERAARGAQSLESLLERLFGEDEVQPDRTHLRQNPAAAPLASFPPGLPRSGTADAPQSTSTSFTGATVNDAPYYPPDTMGAVGPTQFVVGVNGRVRSFDKTNGVADGALNASTDVFFSSVRAGGATSDPRVRFDRLSNRWILIIITTDSPNRILVAVSSGPVITAASSFTFFFMDQEAVTPTGDLTCLLDYPSLGVDRHALYIGGNQFCPQTYLSSAIFVVRKSSILGAGPIVATAFRSVTTNGGEGPWAPQGVDNYDPASTTGYVIGVDNAQYSKLQVRRISDPGGTPSISPNIPITVPTTNGGTSVAAQGGGAGNLDHLDDRLFAAVARNGRIWTAHNIEVDATGAGNTAGNRGGSRWYEIGNLDASPALVQSGTVFDPAGSNPKSYWMPGLNVSGQGHMAIGGTVAGATEYANAWTAGRLAGDPLGTTGAPQKYTNAGAAYAPLDDPGVQRPRRWGDYSFTSVDPEDDMTMWTIQEFTYSANSWGVQAVKLLAPPPATPAVASPATIPAGQSSVAVTITGTSAAGSGFFDPGAGFAKHIAAAVSGGVAVNSVTYVNPTTVTLNVSTVSATAGAKDVLITNPDGQERAGTSILTVSGASGPQAAITPGSIDFGTRQTGSTSPAQTVTVTNSGTSALTLGAASVGGVNAGDFSVVSDGCAGASLAPAASCTIDATFTPVAAGARAAALTFSSNAPGSPHSIALSGTATTPDTTPPSKVTGVVALPASGSISLSWNAATDDRGVVLYRVYRDGALATTVTTPAAEVTGLTNGTSYSFTVRAVDAANNEGAASDALIVTPVAPPAGWLQFHHDVAHTGATGGSSNMDVAPSIAQTISSGGSGADSPVLVDLDRDGALDLVVPAGKVAVGGVNAVQAYHQTATGLEPYWSTPLPDATAQSNVGWVTLAAGDLDADGFPELVAYSGVQVATPAATSTPPDGRMVVLDGRTGAVRASLGSADIAIAPRGPAPQIANVAGDSKPEIVAIRQVGGTGAAAGSYLMTASFAGTTLTKVVDTKLTTNTLVGGVAVGELRGTHDGLEVVTAEDANGISGKIWICTPAGLAANCNESVTANTAIRGVAIADLDGDGVNEIIANGRSSNSLNIVRTAGAMTLFSRADGYLWNTPNLADVDGDGKTDIVNVEYSEFVDDVKKIGPVTVRGFNAGTITDKGTLARTPAPGGSLNSRGGGALADLDGDGIPELVFGSGDNTVVAVSVRNATAAAPPTQFWTLPVPATPIAPPAIGDLTGDGKLDIVVGLADGTFLVLSRTPRASVDVTSLSFGDQRVAQTSASQAITVSNEGDGPLSVASVSVEGADAADFAASGCAGAVAPGNSCTIDVTFTPSDAGARAGAVRIATDAPGGDLIVAVDGTGIGPSLSLSATNVDLGTTRVGATSAPQTVTVTNTGTDTLTLGARTISTGNASDFSIASDTCGTTLAPSASCEVGVEFSPTVAGARASDLAIDSDAPSAPHHVTLAGMATQPIASPEPASVSFGNVSVGATTPALTVQIRNSGTAPLAVSGVTLGGANAAEFGIDSETCTAGTVAVGETCAIDVTFSPSAGGARAATLRVANDGPTDPVDVALSGSGVASDISVSPAAVSFGPQRVGTTSLAQTVTVTSAGSAALSVSAVAIAGTNASDFQIVTDTCAGASLAPGASCTTDVVFAPSSGNARSAGLRITSDAPGAPREIALSGTGTQGAVSMTPSSVVFDDQRAGTTGPTRLVVLENTGVASLGIGAASISGTDAGDFTITSDTCSGATIASGATCAVRVAFAPTTGGARAASLQVTSDAATSPDLVALSGVGTQPLLISDPASVIFGEQRVGTTGARRTITLRNGGTAALAMGAITRTGPHASDFAIATTTCAGAVLAPDETCALGLEFSPSAEGARGATLSVASDAPGSPHAITLGGTGVLRLSNLSLTPAGASFPVQDVGTTSTATTIVVSNVGASPQTITRVGIGGTNAADFAIASDGCARATLSPGDTCSLRLTFRPGGTGTRVAMLSVEAATGESRGAALTGTGAAPAIALDPSSVSYGVRAVGAPAPARAITVTNIGDGTLNAITIAVEGAHAGDFTVTSDTCTGASLAPNARCSVSVGFTPTAAGARGADVLIASNAPGGARRVRVTGTGDAAAPTSTFQTSTNTIITGGTRIAGYSTDDASGVSGVTVTFTSQRGGAPTTVVASLECYANRTWCAWSMPAPVGTGAYTVRARATDAAGNVETPGPSITVIVV